MYGFTSFLNSRNQPPTVAGNQQLELVGYFLPVVGVVLSFVPLAWAPGNNWLWLLRIVVAGLVGIVVVTSHLCTAIDYGDSRNSGVGTAFMLFVGLGIIALGIGAVIAGLVFLFKQGK
jgi:hypothetical protein